MARTFTQLLDLARAGDKSAVAELFPLLYAELRQRAAAYLRDERANHTLQPTALVHEAFAQLIGQESPAWESQAHFFNAASLAMRRILVDHAREHNAKKRGGGRQREPLRSTMIGLDGVQELEVDVERLDSLLTELESLDPRHAQIIQLRFFAGLTEPETARVLGVSLRLVASDWAFARAWLRERLMRDDPHTSKD